MPDLDLAAVSVRLADELREAGVEFEVLTHRRTTTAGSEARVLGVAPEETAKTLITKGERGYVRAVVPAHEQGLEDFFLELTQSSDVDSGRTATEASAAGPDVASVSVVNGSGGAAGTGATGSGDDR